MALQRIIVLGRSGAGKSTLAARTAERLDLPYLATDGLFWTADWKSISMSSLRPWLEQACAAEHWVIDGNFVPFRQTFWARADLAIWLDLPPRQTILRVARRNLGGWLWRRSIWGNRRLTLRRALSGLGHAIRVVGPERVDYGALLAEFPELDVVRLTKSRQVKAWLASIG